MKRLLVIALFVVLAMFGALISCERTSIVHFYNESDSNVILVYKFKDEAPRSRFCKHRDHTTITLEQNSRSYAYRTPLILYILEEQKDVSYDDIMDGLEDKYIQKYILTYEDIEYMRESSALTYPPTAKMQGVEMYPPLSR